MSVFDTHVLAFVGGIVATILVLWLAGPILRNW